MTHVIVFGDSITYGLFDEAGGWVQRLRSLVDKRNIAEADYWTLVYNLGVSGDTAADLLNRIKTELPSRRESDSAESNIILFALGLNDSVYLIDEDRPRFTAQEFRSNVQTLAQVARTYSATVGFVGLFLVDQSAVDPIPWAPGKAYRNSLIRNFDSIIRDLCISNHLHYIELMNMWDEEHAKHYLQDGAHPNSQGHALIANNIGSFFRKHNLI